MDCTKLRLTAATGALIVFAFSCALNAATEESRPIFARICADRDVALLTLIENHADVEDLPAERISEANLALLRARATCYAGETTQAIIQYDAISAELAGLHIDRRQQARFEGSR
jgi:hypothetical protein